MSNLFKSFQNIRFKISDEARKINFNNYKDFVESARAFMKTKIPDTALYLDIGKDAILKSNAYRLPSPGTLTTDPHFPLQFPQKLERLAKNYYYQRGYYNAAESNVPVVKSNFDEPWRNVATWESSGLLNRRALLKRSSQLGYIIGDEIISRETLEAKRLQQELLENSRK